MNENVNFVLKKINPPNAPQTHPIQNCWGCRTQKVYEVGWEAKKKEQLIRRIESKIKGFEILFLESIIQSRQKLDR